MSQERDILNYLQAGNKLSSLEALNLGMGIRLASRICSLKKQGHPIKVETATDGKKYWAVYSIEKITSDQYKEQGMLV